MKKTILSTFLSFAVLIVFGQAGTISANGINIAYESFGKPENQSIILIQGTGEPLTSWHTEFCKRLADRNYHVIRFDSRDTGLSTHLDSLGAPDWAKLAPFDKTCDPAPLPYTLTDMARDVIGLMDGLNIEQAHLVGASMGGAIAQLITINYPTRVLTLATIAASSGDPNLPEPTPLAQQAMSTPPPATTDTDTLTRYLVNVYRALGSIDDDASLRERALMHIKRAWYPEGTARQIAAIMIADNCDRRKDLEKIQVPTVVIHGDTDPLVSTEAANQVANSIKGSGLYIINGMGHDLSARFINPIADLIVRNAKKRSGDPALK
jgi:pimeloyl-ACP methyl ester carboxylesterase